MAEEETRLIKQHLLSIKDEYFEQDQWYDALCSVGLESVTFPTRFVDISFQEATALLTGAAGDLNSLAEKINDAKASLGAERIFVKFLRSPKDASMVYDIASDRLLSLLLAHQDLSIWQLFGQARQEAFGVASAAEAIALLQSSGRVCAEQGSDWASEGGDIWWAVHGARFGEEFAFEHMKPRLMVRTFEEELPLSSEWRAFIWNRRCTAVSQYFYDFAFEELQSSDVPLSLLAHLDIFLKRLDPIWNSMPYECAMLDFVWRPNAKQPIVLIEINPFDPEKGLGHTSSLALFDWEKDSSQIRTGAFIDVRITPRRSESEMINELNKGWPTVGSGARDAMRKALNQLSWQDLQRSHALTRAVAMKLGIKECADDSLAKGREKKGKGAGKEKQILGKAPPGKGSQAAYQSGQAQCKGKDSDPLAEKPAKAYGACLSDILARRRQETDAHVSSNLDIERTNIREGLWLGNSEDAEAAEKLRHDGITHILNCACDVPTPVHAGEFSYLRLDLDDTEAASGALLEVLNSGAAFDFIGEGLRQGGTLVHCRLGRSRSASVLIAFMVARIGCPYADARMEVERKRQLYGSTLVKPNPGFEEVLHAFCEGEEKCVGSAGKHASSD